jgi:hypothetical protein
MAQEGPKVNEKVSSKTGGQLMGYASEQAKRGPANPKLGIGRVNMAYACGGLKQAPKAVLAYLALRYNEAKGCTWVSIGNIAYKTSMSPATVKRALRILCNTEGGRNLITRTLRDERVMKSRKTVIHWDRVEARHTEFRPPLVSRPSQSLSVSQTCAEDLATLEIIANGDPVSTASPTVSHKDHRYDRLDDIVNIGKQYFGAHSVFAEPNGQGILRGCLHNCVDIAGSGDKCLEVLTWICTSPANEGIRKAVLGSTKLGGYIKGAFDDWMAKFDAQGKVHEAAAPGPTGDDLNEIDELFRLGSGTLEYSQGGSQAELQARDCLIDRMIELAGLNNINYAYHDGIGFSVFVMTHASVAHLLSKCCGVPVDPAQFEDIDCGADLREICIWAVDDKGLAKCIAESPTPGAFFIENLGELVDQYEESKDEGDEGYEAGDGDPESDESWHGAREKTSSIEDHDKDDSELGDYDEDADDAPGDEEPEEDWPCRSAREKISDTEDIEYEDERGAFGEDDEESCPLG